MIARKLIILLVTLYSGLSVYAQVYISPNIGFQYSRMLFLESDLRPDDFLSKDYEPSKDILYEISTGYSFNEYLNFLLQYNYSIANFIDIDGNFILEQRIKQRLNRIHLVYEIKILKFLSGSIGFGTDHIVHQSFENNKWKEISWNDHAGNYYPSISAAIKLNHKNFYVKTQFTSTTSPFQELTFFSSGITSGVLKNFVSGLNISFGYNLIVFQKRERDVEEVE